jgi:hypothetical protein
MDTPLAANNKQLTTAELMYNNSKRSAAYDETQMLLGKILDVIKDHSLTRGYPMIAKFVIGGHQSVGSKYDLRTYLPNFGDDEIKTGHTIDCIKAMLEDPTSHSFSTYIDDDDVNEHQALQRKLVVDWSNPEKQ